MPESQHSLVLSCRNRPGIVASVASYLFREGYNVLEAQQFDDTDGGSFFMRIVFNKPGQLNAFDELRDGFAEIAEDFGMHWSMRRRNARWRVMLLVSRSDHCLADLLYRRRAGELNMDITAVVSNHPREVFSHLDLSNIPFYCFPVTPENKAEQEAVLWRLVQDTRTELVVLARYMQILSDDLAAKLAGRCINIHHSFLPGFKGARPYHQAHARGVKLIGATAHYVTGDLDEGPIIEQDVERITHADAPDALIRKGRDIERRVLSRALRYHLDGRVIINGAKTVVFAD